MVTIADDSHFALATRPGMGIDEGLQITYHEMARTLAIIESTDAS